MSDVDEIPSGHTINLLRWCDDIPPILHLHLRNYLYSFEFPWDHRSWRATVHRYRMGKTRYAHFRQTDYLLSDAGWHCSFCFRRISEFIFKMKAYSHNDRVRSPHFLNPKRIQDIICKGTDLYDMLPEEYTFKQIIGQLGPMTHSYSAIHLPAYLLNNADKYKYLMPGNCRRESGWVSREFSNFLLWIFEVLFFVAQWRLHWIVDDTGAVLILVCLISIQQKLGHSLQSFFKDLVGFWIDAVKIVLLFFSFWS